MRRKWNVKRKVCPDGDTIYRISFGGRLARYLHIQGRGRLCPGGDVVTDKTIPFTRENDEGEEVIHNLPALWVICRTCDGDAVTVFGRSRGDEAVHTQEDFDQDPELMDDLMSGRLDRPCPDCDGKGRVLEVDKKALKTRDVVLYKEWMDHEREEREYQAMCRSERMNGA